MQKFIAGLIFVACMTLLSLHAREVPTEQKIAGLYIAFFNRSPDKAGLDYWKNRADIAQTNGAGASSIFKELSAGFASHPVFTSTYGSLDNEAFVRAIYVNALGREGDEEGIAFWRDNLNNGLSRSDMVASFVELSLILDLTPQNFPSLSTAELDAAKLRQDLITNKTLVAIKFVNELGDKTNVADSQNPENDPAYLASIAILSGVTEDISTVKNAEDFINNIKAEDNPIEKIILEWNPNTEADTGTDSDTNDSTDEGTGIETMQWAKSYGGYYPDKARSIQQTNDGGFIVAGYTDSFYDNDDDMWVLKLDKYGKVQWQKTFGAKYADDQANAIQQTSDGGFIIAGIAAFAPGNYFLDDKPVFPDVGGSYDFWVLKLDKNGDIQWQRFYGGSSGDEAFSIQQTTDGGYIVAGHTDFLGSETDTFGAGASDFWVLKLDENGDIQWQKTYGGSGFDEAYAIQQTTDGGFIVAGNTSTFGAGNKDIWILKLDTNGDIQWQKTYGGDSYEYIDGANPIQQTTDGGFIVAGNTITFGAGNEDIWILKLDTNGDIQWQKTYGGEYSDVGSSIQQTTDGGFIVTGKLMLNEHHLGLLKLDKDGNVQWLKTYFGDNPRSIQQTTDGGFVVAGAPGSPYTMGYPWSYTDDFGFWILKFDKNGNIESCSPPLGENSQINVSDSNATVNTTSISPSLSYAIPISENGAERFETHDTNATIIEACAPSGTDGTINDNTSAIKGLVLNTQGYENNFFSFVSESYDVDNYDISAEPWCTPQPALCGNYVEVNANSLDGISTIPTSGYLSDEAGFEDCANVEVNKVYINKNRDGSHTVFIIKNATKTDNCDWNLEIQYKGIE